jgi:hypothetical protein
LEEIYIIEIVLKVIRWGILMTLRHENLGNGHDPETRFTGEYS